MAKNTTVFYKLPIEDMRGKLATKQKGITYAGQQAGETPYDLAAGKKDATNFEKYIVLTKRRGINRFYVKSRTAINNSIQSRGAQASLGAAASIALMYLNKLDEIDMAALQDVVTYYNELNGENITPREFLVRNMVPTLRTRGTAFSYQGIPNEQGIVQIVNIGDNTFASPELYDSEGNDTNAFPESHSDKMNFIKFVKTLNSDAGGAVVKVMVGTQNFDVIAGGTVAEGTTVQDFTESAYGAVYGADYSAENGLSMNLYNKNGVQVATGWLYTDASMTTKVEAETALTNGMQLYLQQA